MIQLLKLIALVLGIGQSGETVDNNVYHHYYINGKEVSEQEFKKPKRSISSLTKKEFVEYYYKSKNIICL